MADEDWLIRREDYLWSRAKRLLGPLREPWLSGWLLGCRSMVLVGIALLSEQRLQWRISMRLVAVVAILLGLSMVDTIDCAASQEGVPCAKRKLLTRDVLAMKTFENDEVGSTRSRRLAGSGLELKKPLGFEATVLLEQVHAHNLPHKRGMISDSPGIRVVLVDPDQPYKDVDGGKCELADIPFVVPLDEDSPVLETRTDFYLQAEAGRRGDSYVFCAEVDESCSSFEGVAAKVDDKTFSISRNGYYYFGHHRVTKDEIDDAVRKLQGLIGKSLDKIADAIGGQGERLHSRQLSIVILLLFAAVCCMVLRVIWPFRGRASNVRPMTSRPMMKPYVFVAQLGEVFQEMGAKTRNDRQRDYFRVLQSKTRGLWLAVTNALEEMIDNPGLGEEASGASGQGEVPDSERERPEKVVGALLYQDRMVVLNTLQSSWNTIHRESIEWVSCRYRTPVWIPLIGGFLVWATVTWLSVTLFVHTIWWLRHSVNSIFGDACVSIAGLIWFVGTLRMMWDFPWSTVDVLARWLRYLRVTFVLKSGMVVVLSLPLDQIKKLSVWLKRGGKGMGLAERKQESRKERALNILRAMWSSEGQL